MTRLACILMTLVLVGGCASDPIAGYSTQSVYRSDVATVSLPIFKNTTFDRDIEFELTDALVKEIEARTPYKVTAGDRADTIILGTVRRVERDQISKARSTGLGEEVLVGVTIDFEWRDLRTNAPLVERKNFSGHGLFLPSPAAGESSELGEFSAVQLLARDIVAEMQAAW